MGYRILADATMVVHFAFLVWVVLGGFVAWRRPWAIWPHLLAATWGLAIVIFGFNCPLTWVEDHFRQAAGDAGLTDGFIDTYLTGVIYPERHLALAQTLVAVAVAISWAGFVLRRRSGRRSAGDHPGQDRGDQVPDRGRLRRGSGTVGEEQMGAADQDRR